eukprot:gene22062-29127_t
MARSAETCERYLEGPSPGFNEDDVLQPSSELPDSPLTSPAPSPAPHVVAMEDMEAAPSPDAAKEGAAFIIAGALKVGTLTPAILNMAGMHAALHPAEAAEEAPEQTGFTTRHDGSTSLATRNRVQLARQRAPQPMNPLCITHAPDLIIMEETLRTAGLENRAEARDMYDISA